MASCIHVWSSDRNATLNRRIQYWWTLFSCQKYQHDNVCSETHWHTTSKSHDQKILVHEAEVAPAVACSLSNVWSSCLLNPLSWIDASTYRYTTHVYTCLYDSMTTSRHNELHHAILCLLALGPHHTSTLKMSELTSWADSLRKIVRSWTGNLMAAARTSKSKKSNKSPST